MSTSTKKNLFFKIFLIFTFVVALLLLIRVVFIIFNGQNVKRYKNPTVSKVLVRGTIYDRNKNILAIDRTYKSLIAHPNKMEDKKNINNLISPYLDIDNDTIETIFNKDQAYVVLQRKLDDIAIEQISNIIEDNKLQNQLEIMDFNFRSYPQNFHAAQIIGFTDIDKKGISGIEYQYEDLLNADPVEDNLFSYGCDVYLTLDMDFQYLLDTQIQNMCDSNLPEYAVGIIMDAKTGEILASSSWPWFNINNFNISTDSQRMNNTFKSSYEPGSVFKIFSLGAILDIGTADVDEVFNCDGEFTFSPNDKNSITINCHESHGEINGPSDMIKYSCNGAVSSWALQTDDNLFYNYLKAMNFGSSLPFDESNNSGYLTSPTYWSIRSKPTISFGQEISSTALQLTTASTIFTNEGNLLRPSLIYKIVDSNNTETYTNQKEIIRKVIKEETANKVIEAMVTATEPGGTAVQLNINGIKVAAKTGTSQILDPKKSGVVASTIAIVDAENPKYIIYIACYNPQGGEIWGANIASPAIRKVIEGLISIGKITGSQSEEIQI